MAMWKEDKEGAPIAPSAPVALTVEDIIKIVQAAKQSPADLAKAATLSRPEMPSNPTAPLVSQLNPLGERDHPRPVLKCLMTMNDGMELERDQLSIEEIELLNALQPGRYRVAMLDGATRMILVEQHEDSLGALNRVNLRIDGLADPDVRVNLPTLVAMLRQMLPTEVRAKILTMADWRELAQPAAVA